MKNIKRFCGELVKEFNESFTNKLLVFGTVFLVSYNIGYFMK